eukprot:6187875-Pleurochrysis_carterae.AAC.3
MITTHRGGYVSTQVPPQYEFFHRKVPEHVACCRVVTAARARAPDSNNGGTEAAVSPNCGGVGDSALQT